MIKKLTLFVAVAISAATAFAGGTAPDRFLNVDGAVYRGAILTTDAQMRFLRDGGIKTIVSMITDKAAHAVEQKLADKYGIKLVWVPIDGFWGPNDQQTG